jgi:hypothetical protein
MLRAHIITIGAVALALAGPTAASAHQDLRSPDTRDAAAAATTGQDLRSPDTRDAAAATAGQELRPPNTGDATRPIAPAQAPNPMQPTGFGWADASLAAAGGLGIMLALAGIALLTTHRRRHMPVARP